MSETVQQGEKKSSFSISLYNKASYGGLIGVNLIILQLISASTLDVSVHTSLIALAVALPCLVISFVLLDFTTNIEIPNYELFVAKIIKFIIHIAGVLGTFISVVAILWHITPEAGQTFIGTSFVIGIAFSLYLQIRTKGEM